MAGDCVMETKNIIGLILIVIGALISSSGLFLCRLEGIGNPPLAPYDYSCLSWAGITGIIVLVIGIFLAIKKWTIQQ